MYSTDAAMSSEETPESCGGFFPSALRWPNIHALHAAMLTQDWHSAGKRSAVPLAGLQRAINIAIVVLRLWSADWKIARRCHVSPSLSNSTVEKSGGVSVIECPG